jgi:hypothetical protein
MKLLTVAALSVAVLSSGCATQMSWQRTDGRPVDGYFNQAHAECRYRTQDREEEAVSSMKRCMARRGYVWAAG